MPEITSFPISTVDTNLTVSQLQFAAAAAHEHANIDLLNQLTQLPADITPEPTEQHPATNGTIPAHISPDGGSAPFYSFTSEQFDGVVTWEPPVENTFDFDTEYTATITLTPRPGVTLDDVDPGIFDIGVPGASVSFDPETATATISFPKTADAPDVSASWQMNYTFPGSKVLFTAASGGRIPLESMSGYDGTQALSDELYYIESPDGMPVRLLYKYDGDTDWREAPFDNFGTGQTGSNTIRSWGWDTGSQSIYIVGSNSTGADIQITLVREGAL